MILFSRSFIRKRVIALLTTATVAAASLALSHDSTRVLHAHDLVPVRYVVNRPDHSAAQPSRAENNVTAGEAGADPE
jgi:hypothetical protein